MARASAKKPGGETPRPAAVQSEPSAEPLGLKALAEGILARTIRPRVTDIRRLAEAVLKPGKKKKKKKSAKKAERKLSKIPGQKGRK